MKKLIIFCFLSFFTALTVTAQFFQWAQKQENKIDQASPTWSGSYMSGGNYLAKGGNILATTGLFYNNITLGNQTFTRSDTTDAYLAVHDLSGNVLWAKQIITKMINQPSVTIDLNQNIIISGIFQDSLYIDGLIFKASTVNKKGVYIVKFSSNGSLVWARSSNVNTGNPKPISLSISESVVSTDGAGNVYLAGNFSDSLTFNNTLIQSPQYSEDVYLVKYNATGALQWAVKTGNPSFSEHNLNLKVTPSGTLYLSSTLSQIPFVLFMGHQVTKINTHGTEIWNQAYVNQHSIGFDLAVDDFENVYITGYFSSNITIGGFTLAATTGSCFLAKINTGGTFKWAKTIASGLTPSSAQAIPIIDKPQISIGQNNKPAIAGVFNGVAQFAGSTINIPPSSKGVFITQLDTAGFNVWVNTIVSTSQSSVIKPSDMVSDGNGNLYLAGNFTNSFQFGNSNLSTTGTSAGFLTKIKGGGANAVSGRAFIDANYNGMFDAPEKPFNQLIIGSSLGNLSLTTDLDGRFTLYAQDGSSTLSLVNIPKYYTAIPVTHAVTFSGTNQIQTGKDFALQAIPNQNDVKVTVTAISVARPGFSFKYRLTYHNPGTTVLADTLNFVYNSPTITYNSSSISPTSINGRKISWYYQNLQPNETRNIDLTFSVPTNSVVGTPLTANATIKPLGIDLVPSDNTFTITHPISGPYDPNDKQVDKPFISPAAAVNGEYLDYTIRFQNIGTDTAFTVTVTDDISTKLELGQFEMLSASHPFKLSLNNNNQLEWRFDNILLPHSTRNEPASHGFVRFRIKTKPGLVLGDSIANNAAIYFDYNAPVITNYAVTKVGSPTGIKDSKGELHDLKLYPNPARNYVMVASEFNKNMTVKVALVNLLGQKIEEVTLPASNRIHYQMAVNKLPKGVYVVQLETEAGRQTQRLVIQ